MISIIDDTGHERFLGNNEPPAGLVKAWNVYGDVPETPMVPRSQWAGLMKGYTIGPDSQFRPYTHFQGSVGQCNADATAAAAESCRMMQGLPMVKLSAADLYDRINGGRDQGSLLEDAMSEMLTEGIGTADTAGLIWKRGQRTSPPAERARFKVHEAFLCPTFDHCFSAVLAGFKLISGILWYGNFNPDADGWLPRGRGSAGGHAVFGFKPAMRGGAFGIWHQNSWGQWGVDGCCVFPEYVYGRDIGGLWAIRTVTDEGGVLPSPVP